MRLGTAKATFTCWCLEYIEVPLLLGPGNDFALLSEPEEAGWHIDIGSDDPKDTIVRCPKHRQVI